MRRWIPLFLMSAPALAAAEAVPVEDLPIDEGPDIEVIEVEQIPGLPVPEEPRRRWSHDDRARPVGTFAMWGSGLRADALTLELQDPEVAIVAGADLPQGVLERRSNLGGMTFGIGYRPESWLRVPEIRLAFGGGDLDARWRRFDGEGQESIEVAMRRLFTFRAELVVGIEYDFGRITPFARGYGAIAFHAAKLKLRHDELGALGSERAGAIHGEVGVEAGLNVMFTDEVGFMLAYRRGLVGPQLHGVVLGLTIRGEP